MTINDNVSTRRAAMLGATTPKSRKEADMQTLANHQIKVNRAVRISQIGRYPASASAMLRAIPAEVIDALPARLIAVLMDAQWETCQASKAIAEADAITEGAVWDARAQKLREVA
jgi:hypothetical protein